MTDSQNTPPKGPDAIRFDDGAAYERYMGVWSQTAGTEFLDWLAPSPAGRWLDVGCGNGAFTETLITHCAPATVTGLDPSEQQLAFARARPALRDATFHVGNAMALPFGDATFDVAVMPLVIFFVPEPAVGVAEMVRVIRPGGAVAAYAWDMDGGGFPYEPLHEAIRARGIAVPNPPSPEASRLDVMQQLWADAGLEGVETREMTVERTFANFDEYWSIVLHGPSVSRSLASMEPAVLAAVQAQMRETMRADANGRITHRARANAVKGRVRAR